MIYQAHQIELWPRLLTATRQVDPILTGALEGLMIQGASLTVTQTGKLQIGAGTMAVEDYEVVKADKLTPRITKLRRLLTEARGLGHPWLQSVAKALKDIETKCETGDKKLKALAVKRDTSGFMQLLPTVFARHYQANLLAQALFMAGFAKYSQQMNMHLDVWMDLAPKIPGGLHAGYGWPVQTPDGWFWIVDTTHVDGQPFVPPTVTLAKGEQPKAWLEGEPLITDWALANALARAEDGAAQRREVG